MGGGLVDHVQRGRAWLTERALPLWLDAGFDRKSSLFYERLDEAGRPLLSVPRRLMVQARQIFVYAHATQAGMIDAGDQVVRAFHALVDSYHEADGEPGWVFSLDPSERVLDPRRDLYGHAFVLLACAWVFRLTGEPLAIRLADQTLAVLEQRFVAAAGGYLDSVPASAAGFRQNPHMHLFEALLALFEATADDRYLAQADYLHRMLLRHFFLPGPEILAEYFDADWRPIGGAEGSHAATLWEPGHHCEWVWLLFQYARARGEAVDPIADALYRRAYRDGITQDGIIVDEVRGDGRVNKDSRRAWPLTEAIKANVSMYSVGLPLADQRAEQAMIVLMRDFLTPQGLWRDHLSAGGRPLSDHVPASTLYHVYLGFSEASRVFEWPAL